VTVWGEYETECAVCGQTSGQAAIHSTSFWGSPGLDTRPPEPDGSHINKHIQRCPGCGYCAPDVSDGRPELLEPLKTDSYRSQLESPDFPEAANSYLCWSLIEENHGEYASAGFACVRAAWVCDDASLDPSARHRRRRAVALLERAREGGKAFAGQIGGEEALLADLLRRSGDFQPALAFCQLGLERAPEKIVSLVLRFEETLVARSDVAHHTLDEAVLSFGKEGWL